MSEPRLPEDLIRSMQSLLGPLHERLRQREDVRQALRVVGLWLIDELTGPERPAGEAAAGSRAGQSQPTSPGLPQAAQQQEQPAAASRVQDQRQDPAAQRIGPRPISGPQVVRMDRPVVQTPLKIGDAVVHVVDVAGTPEEARAAEAATRERLGAPRERPAFVPIDEGVLLEQVMARARLKAEACRWASERRRRMDSGADFIAEIRPTDASLVERARALPDCYLWMLDPYGPAPDDATLRNLAGCYETLASAAELGRVIAGTSDLSVKRAIYPLIAEAQSALRAGLLSAEVRIDRDQMDMFGWLREHTFSERIFIDRHMRVEDPADPSRYAELLARIHACRDAHRAQADASKQQRALLNKAQYHAGRIASATPGPALDDWRKLLTAVEQLIGLGMAHDARDLVRALRPVAAGLPAEIEPDDAARRALDAALRPASPPSARAEDEHDDEEDDEPTRSEEVRRVADMLRGKVAMFIGGQKRPSAQRRLEDAFELAELRWESTRPHESLTVFEPEIARPEVAVVLLAIRWSSHSYGELQESCNRYGKPLVRLPAGYGPNRVAHEILEQISERLQPAR